MEESIKIYTNEKYATLHKDWHIADTDAKVMDMSVFNPSILGAVNKSEINIADVGCGVGGVLHGIIKDLNRQTNVKINGTAFEISEYAVSNGKVMFPELTWINRQLLETDGPYDVIMFIDVFEHLENPWEMLRLASKVSKYMLIRQPLLDNYSNFRTDNYKHQREHWGHIAFFNFRSFIDMAKSTGWSPFDTKLLAPWELNTIEKDMKVPIWKKLLLQKYRVPLSYLISGFYLNGLFKSNNFA